METTGLDEHKGKLLEVGIVLTDKDLNIIDAVSRVIDNGVGTLDLTDDYVKKMHTDNGLFDEIAESGTPLPVTEMVLVKEVLSWKEAWFAPVLAGSCPSFDRRWLEVHMPTLARLVSHRHFDMAWPRTVWDLPKPPGETPHRAIPDILRDIDQLRMIWPKIKDLEFEPALTLDDEAVHAFSHHDTPMGGDPGEDGHVGDRAAFIHGFKAARGVV